MSWLLTLITTHPTVNEHRTPRMHCSRGHDQSLRQLAPHALFLGESEWADRETAAHRGQGVPRRHPAEDKVSTHSRPFEDTACVFNPDFQAPTRSQYDTNLPAGSERSGADAPPASHRVPGFREGVAAPGTCTGHS